MKRIFLLLAFSLLINSCNESKTNEKEIVEKAAENTESSFPIKRMSQSQDILNGIYSELLKNDSQLKKLDENVVSLQQDSRIIQNLNDDIINNSGDYYLLAENTAKSIRDSILKKEILELVKNSSEKFNVKKDKFEELKKRINLNHHKIYSFYQAVKVRKTIPEIEKYQQAHPLKTDSLNMFINKQNQLLNELKNMN
ncbi:hypothetical protein [Epilithonimonas sp.]|uniref:hypothetical protein n=1 Tax=Epilithonimonas sp. TaxID=2894511 RepID=UPI00289CAFAD|nr:hypothetical protein [Epilithonimonas sp.]